MPARQTRNSYAICALPETPPQASFNIWLIMRPIKTPPSAKVMGSMRPLLWRSSALGDVGSYASRLVVRELYVPSPRIPRGAKLQLTPHFDRPEYIPTVIRELILPEGFQELGPRWSRSSAARALSQVPSREIR